MRRLGRPLQSLSAALLLSVLFPVVGQGQSPLGFRGGFNLSEFVGGDSETDSRRGLDLGVAFSPVQVGPLSLMIEGYYRQKGAETLQSALNSTEPPESVEFGLDYVEIPVLARLDFPLTNWLGLYLQGGPAFGWQLDCGVEFAVSGEPGSPTANCNDLLGDGLEDTLRDYELGAVGGGGLELIVLRGLGAITFDARLNRGLTRLTREETASDLKNQSVSLMLGYTLNPSLGGVMP